MKSLIVLAAILATSMAIACPSASLCNGARIIDSSNNVGKVVEVFANGKAIVLLDSSINSSILEVSQLGKGVSCYQHICVNDRIIDSSNNVGKVIEVFDNGKVKVLFDSSLHYSYRSAIDLGKGVPSYQQIVENDRIMDSSNNVGKVAEVFDNGKLKIRFDHSMSYSFRTYSSLGFEIKCSLALQ